jgi:hypothetical protein
VIPVYLALRNLGLLHTALGAIPREIVESAVLGGTSMPVVVARVLLPLSGPGLVTAAIPSAQEIPGTGPHRRNAERLNAITLGSTAAGRILHMTRKPLTAMDMPRFSGIATFFRLPYVFEPNGLDIGVLGVPFDGGQYSLISGARFGPRAVRAASARVRTYNPSLKVNPYEKYKVADCGGRTDQPSRPGCRPRGHHGRRGAPD